MSPYPDTSFFCALYRRQENDEIAENYMLGRTEPLSITTLGVYELQHAVRFEIYRRAHDRTRGYPEVEGLTMLARFDADMERGAIVVVPFDLPLVIREATRLAELHIIRHGYRAFDTLHVATALTLGAREFLSFDGPQRELAAAEGLGLPV